MSGAGAHAWGVSVTGGRRIDIYIYIYIYIYIILSHETGRQVREKFPFAIFFFLLERPRKKKNPRPESFPG